ncbi:MAG: hypothetical protein RBR68_11275 [Tenuifilaceae bacterium]|nr:hypothetical protein [Tenuifilaceae bacterium]
MTKEQQEMYDAIYTKNKVTPEEIEDIVINNKNKLEGFKDAVIEIMSSDNNIFNNMFIVNYNKETQCSIIAKYYNVNINSIFMSPKFDDLIVFSLRAISSTTLEEIYKSINSLYSFNRKEFIIAWYYLSSTFSLFDLFIKFKKDISLLNDEAKAYVQKYKENKKSIDFIFDKANNQKED